MGGQLLAVVPVVVVTTNAAILASNTKYGLKRNILLSILPLLVILRIWIQLEC
jgi:hypothetical protein